MSKQSSVARKLLLPSLVAFLYLFSNVLSTASCECKDAFSSILTESASNISSGETRYFCVCSKYEWSSSGYLVYSGESYNFMVEGDQTWTDYNYNSTANGYTNKWIKLICCEDQWENMNNYIKSLRYPSYPRWAALICCLGRIEDPTDTESCFAINSNSTTKVIQNLPGLATSATIECYANDILEFYGDNAGAINVTITRNS
eukprot:UN00748